MGEGHLIADSLSRDYHLSDLDLTNFLTFSLQHQVPFGLKIRQLPKEISSWLSSLLQNLPEREQWLKEPKRSSTWLGKDIEAISSPLESQKIGIWTNFQGIKNIKSSAPFATLSKKADCILNHSGLINRSQLEPPWTMYHRPLSWLTDLIPASMEMGNLPSFYRDSFEDTELPTLLKNDK